MIIVYTIIRLYEVILIIRILMSWMNPDPSHPVTVWIYRLTEPVLAPVRKVLPLHGMGIDFSPIVVFLILDLIKRFLVGPRVLF
jgi:YggT family protein